VHASNLRGRHRNVPNIATAGYEVFFPVASELNVISGSVRGTISLIGWPLIGRQHFLPRRGEFQMYVRLVDAIELTQCWRGKRTATFCRQFPVVRQQLIS